MVTNTNMAMHYRGLEDDTKPTGAPNGSDFLEMDTGKDPRLCNGKDTAYLAALRIYKEHEGKGHISRLVKTMENHARSLGYTAMTIGVEEAEMRNRAIYTHWDYVNLIMEEDQEGEKVLYYRKQL